MQKAKTAITFQLGGV